MSKEEAPGSTPSAANETKSAAVSGSKEKTDELTFNVGDVINGYKLVKKIDEGGFGQVFKVTKDSKTFYAMKLELNCQEGGSAIKLEINVLNQLPKNSVFPEMKHGGKKVKFHYLVLELLGDNLKMLKARSPNPEMFTDGTWSRLGIQCLYALKTMHDRGFVHRDVKPSNFAIGLNTAPENRSRRVLLFDFGLARKFVKSELVASQNLKNGKKGSSQPNRKVLAAKSKPDLKEQSGGKPNAKPRLSGPRSSNNDSVHKPPQIVYTFRIARPHTDFRGTQQYASPNAYKQIELGRQDDIWSMMYMLAEMFLELPWTNNDDIPIEDLKSQSPLLRLFTDEKTPTRFSSDQYQTITDIDKMLQSCNYYDHPNYEMVHEFLKGVMAKSKVTWDSPYDWETAAKSEELSKGPKSKKKGDKGWEDPKDFFKI
ncbi:hypothetical protein L5515_010744 [Caenorhabditis briggsae]|uniref:Protein kinase domain-containing protein n=2 Tax=Caenorhabditis briggsae TaxID=6238 RepID=A0AAE9JFI4_CAEBR|nr:hypothetical protein L5515_010744 [Caenorhabditis briggsae]